MNFLDVRKSREGAYRQSSAMSSELLSQDLHFVTALLKVKTKIPRGISR